MVEISEVKERGAPKMNSGEDISEADEHPFCEGASDGSPPAISNMDNSCLREGNPVPDTELELADRHAARRSRLKELQQQQTLDSGGAPSKPGDLDPNAGPAGRLSMAEVQQRELLDFLRGLVERDRERREQLKIIKGFLDDPIAFGLQTDVIPTSSTQEEIARRKKEVEYRVSLLTSMLEIYQGELKMLTMAETQPQPENRSAS
jgi:hypothetical protein